ncbi:MAG: SUMF1/EgtB/PvdO family nonheme iron enzyme [Deltaproteobacteria bacterium]|nr:SUMF1/EgtB/PvdO family nonheme iron enzyme [Deltaproteobacteria bacterium]
MTHRPRALRWIVPAVALSLSPIGCKQQSELPPRAEVLVVADTDLPVPSVVGRLRVDVYTDDTWLESADILREDPSDWPVSFSVYSDDELTDKLVWVRLRAWALDRSRDYRGERFRDWGADEPEVDPLARPRLMREGQDVTPPTEPQPLVTVDRLLRVRLTPGVRGSVRVTLHGACAGTMAKFGASTEAFLPAAGSAETCVDQEQKRVPVVESPIDPSMDLPTTTAQGTWGAEPCTLPDPARICVPGGVTVLGSSSFVFDVGLETVPERIARIRSFQLDRYEVTVERYRTALASGFAPTSLPPLANEGDLVSVDDYRDTGYCTWSKSPRGREDYGLSCIPWSTARQFCQFLGGDLPTEAQWEYVAAAAGRARRTDFAWGDALPTCDRAVYGRITPRPSEYGLCNALGLGPRPVRDAEPGDVTPIGAVGLGGSLSEWTLDSCVPYSSECWFKAPITNPACLAKGDLPRCVRGGAWTAGETYLRSARRFLDVPNARETMVGMRCAWPVEAQP